jgi:UrcA family protein
MRYPPILAATVLGAASILAAPAVAADEPKTRVEVSYSDLDLSTEAGRQELSSRFDRAARERCGVAQDGTGSRFARDCYKRGIRLIDQQVAIIAQRQASGG